MEVLLPCTSDASSDTFLIFVCTIWHEKVNGVSFHTKNTNCWNLQSASDFETLFTNVSVKFGQSNDYIEVTFTALAKLNIYPAHMRKG